MLTLLFIPATATSNFLHRSALPVGQNMSIDLWSIMYASGRRLRYALPGGLLRPHIVAYGPFPVLPAQVSEATYGRI